MKRVLLLISTIIVGVATPLVFGLLSEPATAAQVWASVVQVVCTVDLVTITYWHMEESRRLRMMEFHSKMLENVLRPLLEEVVFDTVEERTERWTCIKNKLKEKIERGRSEFQGPMGGLLCYVP